MGEKYLKYLGLVIIGIVIFLAGLLVGRNLSTPSKTTTSNINTVQINPLFTSYTASFQGKITQVNNGILEVESNTFQRGTIKLAQEVKIFDLTRPRQAATPSTDIKSIMLNRPVSINLEYKNNEFQATSLTYLPDIAPR